MAKQAFFFDWIYYEGQKQQMYKVFEPCWLMIINSINKYKEMSEELLEFLFLYAKEYDSNNKKCEQNIMKVFSLFKKKNMGNLGIVLESSAITPYLKNRLKSLVQSGKIQNLKKSDKKDLGSGRKEEATRMVLEHGYNHDYYPINNIFDKEKPYRINTRGLRLEKMGDSVPLFIRELPAYAGFREKASFANLSVLLNEIFLKGASLATQTYSPTVIDQVSFFYFNSNFFNKNLFSFSCLKNRLSNTLLISSSTYFLIFWIKNFKLKNQSHLSKFLRKFYPEILIMKKINQC